MNSFLAVLLTTLIAACAASRPLPSGADDPSRTDHPANAQPGSKLPAVGAVLSQPDNEATGRPDPFRSSIRDDAASTPAPAHSGHESRPSAAENSGDAYICPMHPEVTAPVPRDCPKCGMALVENEKR